MKYKIIIKTPNRMMFINGKQSRTPLTAIIDEKDLLAVKTKITTEGISNFDISPYTPEPKKKEEQPKEVKKEIHRPIKKEEPITEDKIVNQTVLEQLLSDTE